MSQKIHELLELGMGKKPIAKALGISHNVVYDAINWASQQG